MSLNRYNEERTITALLNNNERVWFYIPNDWKTKFFDEIVQYGAKFMDGTEITKDSIGTLMGMGVDKTIGYISNCVWYNSFYIEKSIIKVYYDKYKLGREDFIVSEPNIAPVVFNE